MRFGIYFKTDTQTVQIPVNPQELTVTYGGDNTNYNLIGKGEVVIPRLPKLAVVQIDSFFPKNVYNGITVSNSWLRPEDYVRFFKTLQERRQVFQFIINRYDGDEPMFDTSFNSVISEFAITDRGGESGDVYYTMSVSEYRDTMPQRIEKVSEDVATDTTTLTVVDIRTVPQDEIVVGDAVTVSGPVYETDELEIGWATVSNAMGTVGRVLPPSLIPGMDRIYISGMGWVSRADCVKGNARNNANRAQLLGGHNA